MIKLIDAYILKSFVRNLIFALLSFILIFVLVDLFENLDKFIDKSLNIKLIFLYYLYFMPEILKLITPVATLLAALFTTSKFVNFSEMTAFNSSGISIYRFFFPILIFGIFLTGLSFYFNGWVVPKANSAKFRFERDFLGKNQSAGVVQNLIMQQPGNIIVQMDLFDEINNSANNVLIQKFDSITLKTRIDIKSMKYDPTIQTWMINNATRRDFDSTNMEKLAFIKNTRLDSISELKGLILSPEIIKQKQLKPDEMLLTELGAYIDRQKLTGLDTARNEVDYNSKISFPFANLVTIIFGVSLSSNRRKSGAALQFGISLLVTFIYLGFLKISLVFGYNGDINPILTAWMANILFALVAFYYLLKINKR